MLNILRFHHFYKKEGKVRNVIDLYVSISCTHENFNLNHRLILKKLLRIIKFNQKVHLKPLIDLNTSLKAET